MAEATVEAALGVPVRGGLSAARGIVVGLALSGLLWAVIFVALAILSTS